MLDKTCVKQLLGEPKLHLYLNLSERRWACPEPSKPRPSRAFSHWLANDAFGACPVSRPRPRRAYTRGRFRARPPSRSRTAVLWAERGAPRREKMNGTRGWCTLLDEHPEEQTAVRKRGLAVPSARLYLASSSAALAPRGEFANITWCRARCGQLPAAFLFSPAPRRAVGFSGSRGMETLLRLEDSRRSCPCRGHCGSCP